ncbi:hypothetical protein DFH06DRAFT_1180077 [Mycena polygramma]|nr:hypothetical protein DFH06DRAFT_1180077 [Mycena polygramma]
MLVISSRSSRLVDHHSCQRSNLHPSILPTPTLPAASSISLSALPSFARVESRPIKSLYPSSRTVRPSDRCSRSLVDLRNVRRQSFVGRVGVVLSSAWPWLLFNRLHFGVHFAEIFNVTYSRLKVREKGPVADGSACTKFCRFKETTMQGRSFDSSPGPSLSALCVSILFLFSSSAPIGIGIRLVPDSMGRPGGGRPAPALNRCVWGNKFCRRRSFESSLGSI